MAPADNVCLLRLAAAVVLLCDVALTVTIIVLDRVHHIAPPTNGAIDTGDIIGWLGTFGAVFIFGCYGILIKTPAVRDAKVDPMVFQAYYSMGVCLISILIWAIAGSSDGFVFSWLGILFAALWISSQVFAFNAIQAIGYAVGPAIWAGLTIIISFFWGVGAFSNPVKSWPGSAAALLLLVCGISLAAASSVAPARPGSARSEAREVVAPSDNSEGGVLPVEGRPAEALIPGKEETPEKSRFVPGFLCAVGCGLGNGSLMVPMTCFQNGSTLLNVSPYSGEGIAPIAFLPSLVIGIAIVQPLFFLAYFARTFGSGRCPEFHLSVAVAPGLLTGCFWGMGNFAAMFGSTYLGQTVGFPLTQMCIIVNGFWGILFYQEISGPLPVGLFAAACLVIIGGAYLDGSYG